MYSINFKKLILPLSVAILSHFCQTAFAAIEPIQEVFEPAGEFPADRFWKVAVIQWNPDESYKLVWSKEESEVYQQRNREAMAVRIRAAAAQGAKYISLSEFSVTGYPDIPELPSEEDNFRSREDIQHLVELIPGPSTDFFSKLAVELKVWIQFGLAEKDLKSDRYYNSAVVLNEFGQIQAHYRKQNLFHLEESYLSAGTENVVFDSPVGKVGLLLCSDVYASNVLRKYRTLKVDVLSLSTSWAESNTGMFYFRQAASQVGAYLLAANQTYFPDSGVIDPQGKNQSHIRQSLDSIAYGYLPLKP